MHIQGGQNDLEEMPGERPVEVARATTGPLSVFPFKEEQSENCQSHTQQATCVVSCFCICQRISEQQIYALFYPQIRTDLQYAHVANVRKPENTVENALLP